VSLEDQLKKEIMLRAWNNFSSFEPEEKLK